ncbi:hypothetical protein QFZ81_003835 [Paenibacillus sp. V4I9]|nr:hypothetical protein [Paenibacillus sp. V4I9]
MDHVLLIFNQNKNHLNGGESAIFIQLTFSEGAEKSIEL